MRRVGHTQSVVGLCAHVSRTGMLVRSRRRMDRSPPMGCACTAVHQPCACAEGLACAQQLQAGRRELPAAGGGQSGGQSRHAPGSTNQPELHVDAVHTPFVNLCADRLTRGHVPPRISSAYTRQHPSKLQRKHRGARAAHAHRVCARGDVCTRHAAWQNQAAGRGMLRHTKPSRSNRGGRRGVAMRAGAACRADLLPRCRLSWV